MTEMTVFMTYFRIVAGKHMCRVGDESPCLICVSHSWAIIFFYWIVENPGNTFIVVSIGLIFAVNK